MSNLKYVLLMAGFLALAGCSSPTVPDPDTSDTTPGDVGADTSGTGGDSYDDGTAVLDDSSVGELANIIYFDFDSSEVRSADTDTVAGSPTVAGRLTEILALAACEPRATRTADAALLESGDAAASLAPSRAACTN